MFSFYRPPISDKFLGQGLQGALRPGAVRHQLRLQHPQSPCQLYVLCLRTRQEAGWPSCRDCIYTLPLNLIPTSKSSTSLQWVVGPPRWRMRVFMGCGTRI